MLSPYLVENRHVAIKRCRHGLFMYNRNDAFIGRGLDLYGEWCDFEIQTLRPFVKLGDTIVDVGANIGTHTVAFANMVGPAGTVHAFEPQRPTFLMLSGNVALNGLDNVFCHQQAVGDSSGEISLPTLPPAGTFFNFGSVSLESADVKGETVPLITLDSLKLTACRLLKIDVEEMEPKVIAGARRTIKDCQPILYVENDRSGGSRSLSGLFKELGYKAYWSICPYFDPRNFYSNTVNVWAEYVPSINLLCLPAHLNAAIGPELEPFLGESDEWQAAWQRIRNRALK